MYVSCVDGSFLRITQNVQIEADGWSATWGYVPNRFHVFSTNAHPFDQEGTYDKFSLYAYLEHDGDFNEAAKGLAAEGYGSQKQSAKWSSALKDRPVKTKNKTHKSSSKHLAECPDGWINLIEKGLKQDKFSLGVAVEASSRMAMGDNEGAWRMIRQNGGLYYKSRKNSFWG